MQLKFLKASSRSMQRFLRVKVSKPVGKQKGCRDIDKNKDMFFELFQIKDFFCLHYKYIQQLNEHGKTFFYRCTHTHISDRIFTNINGK